MKERILEILRGANGEYVSGQRISDKLGVSRTAVWKAIGKLREDGYPIGSVSNLGYRLGDTDSSDILNQAELDRLFAVTEWAGHPVVYKDETTSTQDEIMRLSDTGAPEGTLAVTVRQTKGKGRRGRTWISPDNGNVYMSILLKPDLPTDIVPMVTIVMALAVCEAAEEAAGGMNGSSYRIKWPNDIVVSSDSDSAWKKICGILTEMRLEEKTIKDVVIGDGLNINMTGFPPEITENATSMMLASGQHINRAKLVVSVWKHFEQDYRAFEKAGSLAPLKDKYESLLVNKGRRVRVLDPQDPYEGTADGIDQTGALLVNVKTPDGDTEIRKVAWGEVSVRGVEGYV